MSGSQKYIKIVSILNIIGGALYVLIGILGFLGKGMAMMVLLFIFCHLC